MSVASLLGQPRQARSPGAALASLVGQRPQCPSCYRYRDPEDGKIAHAYPVSLAGHLQIALQPLADVLAHELSLQEE